MKRLFTLALSLVAALVGQPQDLSVGTYNVRYQNESDAKQGNGWSQRCPVICEILSYESPDIFGTQEAKVGQIHDLLKGLPEYDYIGVARDDGREEGEYSAIFYHKGRLKKIRSGKATRKVQERQTGRTQSWDLSRGRVPGSFLTVPVQMLTAWPAGRNHRLPARRPWLPWCPSTGCGD